MTQTEIIRDISKKTGVKAACVKEIIAYYQNALIDEIVADGKLVIPGFGSFTVKERSEKDGRNPKTGEPIKIAAHKTVSFKVGKYLKDNIQ